MTIERCIRLSFWGVERATPSLTTTTKILSYIISMVQRMDQLKDYSEITKKLLEMHVW